MKTVFKILMWFISVILMLLILVILFLGPIVKIIVEKNSEDLTGRVIRMNRLRINAFNGHVNVYGLKIYETDKKTLFLGIDQLFANIDQRKLFRSVYHVEEIEVNGPIIRVEQKGSSFNFDDLIKKFSPDPKKPKDPADTIPAKYFIDDLTLSRGKIVYINDYYKLNAEILNIAVRAPRLSWNDPELNVIYSFMLKTGGAFLGKLELNTNTLSFDHKIQIGNFNLAVFYPYLVPYLKIKELEGYLSIDLATIGNFNDPMAIAIKGTSAIQKLMITDEKGGKVAGVKLFNIVVDSLNLKKNIWGFGNILVDEPYFRFELFPEMNNLSQLLVTGSDSSAVAGKTIPDSVSAAAAKSNPFIVLSNYINTLAKEVIISEYRVKRFSITDGTIEFKDHTLDEEFDLVLSRMFLDIQQINSAKGRATADFSTEINRDGFMMSAVSINPLDFLEFDITYELKNVAVVDYNPYSIFHIAYPFTKGKFNYTGVVSVKDHKIKMDNKVFAEKIYVGKKIKKNKALKLPVKLALAIMRDKEGNINLVVPVEGDLDNPKFNWWKIVGQILKNLIIKAATAPFDLLAGTSGGSEDDFKEIKFNFDQWELNEKQSKQLKLLTTTLVEKPELVVEFKQTIDTAKAREYLAYFEAKKRYYFDMLKKQPVTDSLTKEDIQVINNLATTDMEFRAWLDRKLQNTDPLLSTLDKCYLLVGRNNVKAFQRERMERRNRYLENYLVNTLGFPANRFTFTENTDPGQIPEDKIPRYLITYSVPEE